MSKIMQITNIPEEDHRSFKARCVEKGVSMQDPIRMFIKAVADGRRVYMEKEGDDDEKIL